MNIAVQVAENLSALGFIILAVGTVVEWYRRRNRAQAMLAWALVLLAVTAALGRIQQFVHLPSILISPISITAFLGSGYFILLFRHEFLPLRSQARLAATALLIVAIALGFLLVALPPAADRTLVLALTLGVVLTWAVLVGEPIARFWIASRSAPGVQRAQLRAFSFGFAVLIAILLIDVLGGSAVQSPAAVFATQLVALAMVPAIYVSFAPPTLLRTIWRMGETDRLRAAMQDLLMFSPNPQALAEQAVGWAVRLVGAQAGFIADGDGKVVASRAIGYDTIATMLKEHPGGEASVFTTTRGETVMMTPLNLPDGKGWLGVVAGRFTPVFGLGEIHQLSGYASAVAAGMERTRVTERMAALEAQKTQFLNLASHELRGPLTVIRGYSSMLESGLLGELNERGKKAAPIMVAKVLEMNGLIEQMIEAARLEDGALVIKAEPADLRDIASAAVARVKPLVDDQHHVTLQTPDRPVRVRVDVGRIQTIVSNLIDNALKYSPDGGDVICTVTLRGGVAKVAVKDHGVGIAKKDMPTLFTRFGRVAREDTNHLPGTGLGLYLGRQLARLHGGEITVESEPDRGSTFTLHLPVADRSAVGRAEGDSPSITAGAESVPSA
jgi:signal transduction histidine kinase